VGALRNSGYDFGTGGEVKIVYDFDDARELVERKKETSH